MEQTGASGGASPAIDVEAAMDASRIRELHIRVAVLGALVLFMDGFNTQVIGYIMPELSRRWQLPHSMFGLIFSSGLVGVLVGQLCVAPLGARFGPKRIMVLCTAAFGSFTVLTAYATDANALIALRFLTGIGLGGAMPVTWSLIGEYAPKRWRSTFLVCGTCGITFGSMAAGVLAAAILSRYGWQSVLWAGGGFTLAVALCLIAALPESLQFSIVHGGDRRTVGSIMRRVAPDLRIGNETRFIAGTPATRSTISQLFQPDRRLGTAAIWCAFFMLMMVYYFVQNWLTTVLVDAGHSQETAITVTTIIQVGGICSAFVVGPLMDRLNHYVVLAMFFIAGGVFVALTGAVADRPAALPMIVAFWEGFSVLGLQKGMIALTIHFYPIGLRSTALGWGTSFGRSGAVLGPLIAGGLLTSGWKTSWLFYASTVPMLLGALALLVLWRFDQNRSGALSEGAACTP